MPIMADTFLVSASLLVVLLVIRKWELARGVVYAQASRAALDRACVTSVAYVQQALHRAGAYVKRDIFMRLLHVLTYLALVLVRAIERRLVALVGMFRTMRRGQHRTESQVRESSGEDDHHTQPTA